MFSFRFSMFLHLATFYLFPSAFTFSISMISAFRFAVFFCFSFDNFLFDVFIFGLFRQSHTSIHTTTGQIPFEMIFGRLPVLPFDHQQPVVTLAEDKKHVDKLKQYLIELTSVARHNIERQQHVYRERYNQNRRNPTYRLNDLVLVKATSRRSKFDIRYEGPFRIVQQLGTKTFIVKHVKKQTLVRQVTLDVLIALSERRTID